MRTVTVVAGVLAAALGLVSSGMAGEEADAPPRTASLTHTISVEVEYPVTGQAKVDRLLQEWLEERVEAELASRSAIALDPDFTESALDISFAYHVVRPSARAVSFVFDAYTYPSRAAHPLSRVSVLNIDLANREKLALDDIFAHPGRALALFAEKAPAAVRRDFADRYPDTPQSLEDDLFFPEGFAPTAENYHALVLDPTGIRIIFQPYQILPYAFGRPEAFIPLSELSDAGPDLSLWNSN